MPIAETLLGGGAALSGLASIGNALFGSQPEQHGMMFSNLRLGEADLARLNQTAGRAFTAATDTLRSLQRPFERVTLGGIDDLGRQEMALGQEHLRQGMLGADADIRRSVTNPGQSAVLQFLNRFSAKAAGNQLPFMAAQSTRARQAEQFQLNQGAQLAENQSQLQGLQGLLSTLSSFMQLGQLQGTQQQVSAPLDAHKKVEDNPFFTDTLEGMGVSGVDASNRYLNAQQQRTNEANFRQQMMSINQMSHLPPAQRQAMIDNLRRTYGVA